MASLWTREAAFSKMELLIKSRQN